jgi:hypothetical protein
MSKQTRSTLSKKVVGGALLAAGGALVALKAGGKLSKVLKPKAAPVPLPKVPRPEPEALSRMEGEGGGSKLDLEQVAAKP